MKSIIIFLFILIASSATYTQTIRLGLTADFLVENKYLDYEFGPSLTAEYRFQYLPISIQGKTRLYLGELSEENNFPAGFTFSNVSVGINFVYLPIRWDIDPFVGLGIYYNIYDLKVSGNRFYGPDDRINSPGKFNNNLSFEITSGLKFSANTPINFITEVTKTFNHVGNVNFNSLFLKIGLLFKL